MSSPDNKLTTKIPIKDRNGRVVGHKEVALYSGLLAKAHTEGLKAIKTTLLYFPDENNGHLAVGERSRKGWICITPPPAWSRTRGWRPSPASTAPGHWRA